MADPTMTPSARSAQRIDLIRLADAETNGKRQLRLPPQCFEFAFQLLRQRLADTRRSGHGDAIHEAARRLENSIDAIGRRGRGNELNEIEFVGLRHREQLGRLIARQVGDDHPGKARSLCRRRELFRVRAVNNGVGDHCQERRQRLALECLEGAEDVGNADLLARGPACRPLG